MATKIGTPGGGTDNVPQTTQTPWPVPDWLSPARLIALSAPQVRPVVLAPATETLLLPPNPRRVSLLIICPNASAAGFVLAPVPNLGADGIAFATGSNWFLASLSDWVSLTCGAWYGYSAGGTTVRVIDTVRT